MLNLNVLPLRIQFTSATEIGVAFGDSYLEPGMVADIMSIARHPKYDDAVHGRCYLVTFDTEKYYDHNLRLMPEAYYPNSHTPKNTERRLFTAVEAGYYKPTVTLGFYVPASVNPEEDIRVLDDILREYCEANIPNETATKAVALTLLSSHRRLREILARVDVPADEQADLIALLKEAKTLEDASLMALD